MAEAGIHALHGLIGSGKTTFARRLERELPGLRFTPDEWLVALYGVDPPADLFPVYFARVLAVMEVQWTRALELGLPVILDYGFWSRADRDALREKAAALRVPLTFYALSVPDAEALRRIHLRNQQSGALQIADATFRLCRDRFQPLDPDEAAVSPERAEIPRMKFSPAAFSPAPPRRALQYGHA